MKMVTLRLDRDSPLMDLTGQKVSSRYEIEHETPKALLVSIVRMVDGMEVVRTSYWFPRSMVIVDGDRSGPKVIKVPDWLWNKKVQVRG